MKILTWILSSSVLILAVMLLRRVLKGRMQPGVRYALWGLVLLRLLIPWEVGHVPFGVAAAVESVSARVQDTAPPQGGEKQGTAPDAVLTQQPGGQTYRPTVQVSPVGEAVTGKEGVSSSPDGTGNAPEGAGTYQPAAGIPGVSAPTAMEETAAGRETEGVSPSTSAFGWRQALLLLWAVGAVVTAAVIAIGNGKLYAFLLRARRPLSASGKHRVYAAEGLGSSCLFGNSIYVTGEALTDAALRRYVLAHEDSHACHGDFYWSMLRCLALTVHWFNPLVWLAAELSRRDAEMFADAGALRTLGEEERQAYGLALIRLYAGRPAGVSLAVTASTMSSGKKTLRERIANIASRPRLTAVAGIVLVLCVGLAVACSFGGGKKEKTASNNTYTQTENSLLLMKLAKEHGLIFPKDIQVLERRESEKGWDGVGFRFLILECESSTGETSLSEELFFIPPNTPHPGVKRTWGLFMEQGLLDEIEEPDYTEWGYQKEVYSDTAGEVIILHKQGEYTYYLLIR